MERSEMGEGEGKVAAVMGLAPRPGEHGGHGQQQQQVGCFSDEVDSPEEAGVKERRGEAAAPGVKGVVAVVAKRRRGRPPGSKNKPKPPVVVTREAPEPAAAMRPHVLEIPGGGDVAGALAGFARRRGLGICVLAGTGAVANVSLRHQLPSAAEIGGAAAAAVVVFHGRYEILSISATFLPPAMSAAAPHALGGLSISLAGPHGQIVGGAVAGPLVAATTVVVVAAAFASPTFHRLPAEDEAPPASVSGSGTEADEHQGHQTEPQEHRRLTPLHPRSMAPATTQPAVYASVPCQHEDVWSPAAASAPRPRPPYQ